MNPTRNELPERTRIYLTNVLQKILYEAIDLSQQAKQAHWNIKSVNFLSIHELFDKVHEEIENSADLIAERILQLGGVAEGTSKAVGRKSTLPDYPTAITEAAAHIEFFLGSASKFTKTVRQSVEEATQWKDLVTADILTQVTRGLDKQIWILESHLPSDRNKVKLKEARGKGKITEIERVRGH